MRKYEIMYILTPELDDETRKNEVASLAIILTSNGATIDETNEWGLRDLAYEINKVKKGYYVVLKLSTETPKCIEEFNRITRLDSKVLRSLVTVID